MDFILVFIVGCIYFAPGILAMSKHSKRAGSILVVNLLLGWTAIGWVFCLIWAGFDGPQSNSFESTKKCPKCAETVKAEAKKCRFCGADI